ncbi:MAG: hypothetical protein PHN68_00945 [Prolixibacteraceae bacterium]|jgi:hypothetical protein|nr:hypothetical protein [Prolixibacteraceae bacterium]
MKNLGFLFCNFETLLKKYFFNNVKTDIYHVCEDAYNSATSNKDQSEDNDATDYKNKYNSTTRWQTI